MSPEKEKALCKDFPHLFRDYNTSVMQSGFGWGFQCSDGWEPLLRKTAKKLEPLIVKMIDEAIKNNETENLDSAPTTSCIKEKYGTLCWYLTSGTDEMYKLTDEAEEKSAKICEECGKRGRLHGSGWYYTACVSCHKKREEKHGKRTT
jgi:hypothetical protein